MVALAPGHPESVGMSSDLLERAAGVLADAIAAGDISAASIVVSRGPHVVLQRGLGRSRPDAQGEAVGPDSVFLLASISKAFAAISLMTLVDRGLVSLLDPVEAYLPGFTPGRRVTVRDLLTHTAGLPLQLPEDQELRRAHAPLSTFVERALTTPLIYEPRSDWSCKFHASSPALHALLLRPPCSGRLQPGRLAGRRDCGAADRAFVARISAPRNLLATWNEPEQPRPWRPKHREDGLVWH